MNDENTKRGSLLPNEQALLYFRKQFVASAKAQGRLGKFYQVHEVKVQGTDKEFSYKDPVDVAYHLDTTPSRKLLTKYGWFVEDTDSVPIILYLNYFDINDNPIHIDEGAQIELSGKATILPDDIISKLFQITDLRTDLELNQCVCKVVPVRLKQTENVKVLADKKDPNLENVYFDRKIYYEDPPEEEPVPEVIVKVKQQPIDEPEEVIEETEEVIEEVEEPVVEEPKVYEENTFIRREG